MEQAAKQVVFVGRVQGVGFRYTTHRIAGRYDVTGYVKNCPDGTVEAFIQGSRTNVQACLDDIHNTFGGYIREMKTIDKPPNPQYSDFRITF